jgi:peptidoglycan-associated lipoprotein
MRKFNFSILVIFFVIFSAVFFTNSCAPKKAKIDQEAIMKEQERKAAEEARIKAEEDERRKFEEAIKAEKARKAAEEARVRAEEEARLKAEEEKRIEEERLKAEEAEITPQIAREAETKAVPQLDDIHFDFDKSDIRADSREILQKNAEWLQNNPDVKIQIEGHCDERGTAEYNLALGERRAMSTKKYLASLGISADRIYTISYGEELPIDPGHDEGAWAKNRRAHFLVITK